MIVMFGFLVLKRRLCFVDGNGTLDCTDSQFLSKLSFGLQFNCVVTAVVGT